jgi:hypothetical protein
MTVTTVPIDTATRDRLRAFARKTGNPHGARKGGMTYDQAVNALLDLAERGGGPKPPARVA